MAHTDEEVLEAFRAAETVSRGNTNYDLLGYALVEFAWGGSLEEFLATVRSLDDTTEQGTMP
jgi:hypothetical protein